MTQFTTRAYNKISLDSSRGVIKKSSNTDRLKDERDYYSNIPSNVACHFPRMFNSGRDENNDFFMELEFFGYPNLGSLLLEKNSNVNWKEIAKNLCYILTEFDKVKYELPASSAKSFRHDMFVKKTEREFENLSRDFAEFEKICQEKYLTINDVSYPNFNQVWPEVKKYIEADLVNEESFSFIHGDFCFSNILCHKETSVLRLIDPRGSFGKKGPWGDPIYDVAKLLHSTLGLYEAIIYDKFDVTNTNSSISFNFNNIDTKNLSYVNDLIHERFDKKKTLTIMGTIFVGMCARHYDSIKRQKVMYATGIKSLYEAMEL